MRRRFTYFIPAFLCLLLLAEGALGQDNKKAVKKKRAFFHNIFNRVRSSITVSKVDSINKATVINAKSEIPFLQYKDKIIRNIKTDALGFEKIFTDTSKVINYYGTRILNTLHIDTYEWVIRDNLMIKKGSKLNPYIIADNERYLRSLEFIQDARILVKPIAGSTDSVDILVVTKDLFSITGSASFSGLKRQRITVAETNVAGAGQKIQVTALRDINRNPVMGYDFLYSKNSLLHTFISGTAGFSKVNSDRTGTSNVESAYLLLSRPLISPYSRAAGALELRFNHSKNLYQAPDSLFLDYKNSYLDVWAGYNIGVKWLLRDIKSRNRTFIAARFINNHFSKTPYQFGKGFNSYFNNVNAVLGEVTFFKQEFYKTNYIFGFGTTEDVPYGYNVAVTGGWYKQLNLARPYFGVNANRYIATEKGKFMQVFLRTGGFYHKGKLQDVSLLAGGSLYSKLYLFERFKMRQYFRYSYSKLYNRIIYDPLQINNPFGLRYFRADSLRGTQRVSLYAETFFFAKYKLFGFQLAPFGFVDATMLTAENKYLKHSDIYTGVGGGLRTRNVNLVFGTAELRFTYFPRKAQDMSTFKVSFNGNIRFRYNQNYVKAPDIIRLNNDNSSSFY